MFFFFKQKTAYEMRISDWSSDVCSSDLFKLDGRDITTTVNVAPWEAALGGKIAVPTLGGTVELTLASNSRSGQKLRLKNRGLPGKGGGDQFVMLQVVIPAVSEDRKSTRLNSSH